MLQIGKYDDSIPMMLLDCLDEHTMDFVIWFLVSCGDLSNEQSYHIIIFLLQKKIFERGSTIQK